MAQVLKEIQRDKILEAAKQGAAAIWLSGCFDAPDRRAGQDDGRQFIPLF